jgi:2-polyprenyl-6-methoxyphenol hydroxylase-like FAD-dependent oxidoreductase
MGLYERLPSPTRERVRYTPEDEAEVVQRWAHLPISPGLTVGEAYAARTQAGLAELEEGVVDEWSGERTVLVGDAAHKFTPSTGAGWNTGMEDVVVLVNELVRKMKVAGGWMGIAELREVGRVYQEARFGPVVGDCELAGRMTRLATWGSGVARFVDRWVMGSPKVQRFLIDKGAQAVSRTPVLEFAEGGKMEGGRVPWVERESI